MCIRDRFDAVGAFRQSDEGQPIESSGELPNGERFNDSAGPVSYTHLRAHETVLDLVCRLLLEKKTTIRTSAAIIQIDELIHHTNKSTEHLK